MGGRVYEIKTLCSNLVPEEGGGCLFEGGRIIKQVRYKHVHTVAVNTIICDRAWKTNHFGIISDIEIMVLRYNFRYRDISTTLKCAIHSMQR